MRVLYVINSFDPGGAEHGLLSLIRNGFFRSVDLDVFAICRGRGGLADEIARLQPGVTIASPQARLSLGAMAMAAFRLFRLIQRTKPDAVILSLKQANILGRALLILFPKIHCVSFEHIARYRARRAEGVYGVILRALSFRVDEIWADCAETLREVQQYFSRRHRAEDVVPLFWADARTAAKQQYELGTPVRIACAGRLVGRKRMDLAVELVRALNADGVQMSLEIFGDGPEEAKLAAMIRDQDLAAHVTLKGYRADWLGEAADCDLFLNLSETEGFCIVVAEAMSAGLPVLATDVGGIRDYGQDEGNMIKLSDLSLPGLKRAIKALTDDAVQRQRIGREAHRYMLTHYPIEAVERAGEAIFDNMRRRKG